jgi:hypothetical protein
VRRFHGAVFGAVLALSLVVGCGSAAGPDTAGSNSSLRPATAAPERTPDPDQVAAADALRAFIARSAMSDASFHLEQRATMKTGTQKVLDAAYGLDVAGSDFAGTIAVGGQTAHLRSVDGRVWYSPDGATWTEGDPIDAATSADILSPWSYLGPLDELRFLSRDPVNLDNFQFRNDGPIPYATDAMRRLDIDGTIDQLNFIVDPSGAPVTIALHASATPSSGPLEGKEVDIFTAIDFTRFGEPISIVPPA